MSYFSCLYPDKYLKRLGVCWKCVSFNRNEGKRIEHLRACTTVQTHTEERWSGGTTHRTAQIAPFVKIKRNDCLEVQYIHRRTWPGNEVDLDRLFSAVGAVQGAYCLAAHCFLYLYLRNIEHATALPTHTLRFHSLFNGLLMILLPFRRVYLRVPDLISSTN